MAGKMAAIKTQAKRDDRWTYGRTKNLAGIVFSDSLTFFPSFYDCRRNYVSTLNSLRKPGYNLSQLEVRRLNGTVISCSTLF